MLTLAIATTAAALPFSLWLLARNPFNIAAVASVLTWLFGVLPAIYFNLTGDVPSYSWGNYTFEGRLITQNKDIVALLVMCLMGASFTIGSYVAWVTAPTIKPHPVPPRETSTVATYIMVGIWVAALLYHFSLSGWDVKDFLLPVREYIPRNLQSGYLLVVFIMMPLAIAAKSYWAKGRIDRWMLFWIGMAVMAAFSRSQRRDFVTMALFVVALLVLVGELILKPGSRRPRVTRKRKAKSRTLLGLAMLMGSATLVPILWYSRVYFTAADQGKVVDPTEIRSFTDLLLGSPATGYPTLVLIRDYVIRTGSDAFYMPIYLLGAVVPRFIWPGKPTQLDKLLEDHYRLMENPSAFWFGELFYSFGSGAIIAALVFGFAMFRIAHAASMSPSLIVRTIGVVIFMQSVTFYKNGFAQFAINSLMFIAFLLFAWWFPVSGRQQYGGYARRATNGPNPVPRKRRWGTATMASRPRRTFQRLGQS